MRRRRTDRREYPDQSTGGALVHSFTAVFEVAAPARKVWRILHPPVAPDAPSPRVLEYPGGSMEILTEGDEAGQGLVRTCVFGVPRYLLSRQRLWEHIRRAVDDTRRRA